MLPINISRNKENVGTFFGTEIIRATATDVGRCAKISTHTMPGAIADIFTHIFRT